MRKLPFLPALAALFAVSASLASAQAVRIVGGGPADGPYPFMTALVQKGMPPSSGQFCGGALIAPQWVLTAAHCMEDTPASTVDVWIGGQNLLEEGEGIRVSVAQVIMHPSFGVNSGGALEYDFCLLKLARPVTEVEPLPLVDNASQVAVGVQSRILGWGLTSENGVPSLFLKQVDLPIASLSAAGAAFGGLNATHLAAGVAAGGTDSCQGDSGGPLLVKNSAGKWLHGGVVSFGEGCARPNRYGIYGNTLTLKPWIQAYVSGIITDDHGGTLATATAFGTTLGSAGTLERTGDVDLFKFRIATGGTVIISSSGTTDTVGALLNSSGGVLVSDDNAGDENNFRIIYNFSAGATAYLKVSGKGTGSYTLSGAYLASKAGSQDITVKIGTNNVPLFGKVAFGTLPLNGPPVKKTIVVANSGKRYLVVSDTILYSTDPDFSVLSLPDQRIAPGKGSSFQVSFTPTATGTRSAYLVLENDDPDENPYTLELTGGGSGPSDLHGNIIAGSMPMKVPSTISNGFVNSETDLDFFTFTINKQTSLIIRTTGKVDTFGRLYSLKGKELLANDDTSWHDYNFNMTVKLDAGTYYIEVSGRRATDLGPYGLVISKN